MFRKQSRCRVLLGEEEEEKGEGEEEEGLRRWDSPSLSHSLVSLLIIVTYMTGDLEPGRNRKVLERPDHGPRKLTMYEI